LRRFSRQTRDFQGRVNLKRRRHVIPIECVSVRTYARMRVFGGIVIFPGSLDLSVRRHGIILLENGDMSDIGKTDLIRVSVSPWWTHRH
jgi:hypothetical protein